MQLFSVPSPQPRWVFTVKGHKVENCIDCEMLSGQGNTRSTQKQRNPSLLGFHSIAQGFLKSPNFIHLYCCVFRGYLNRLGVHRSSWHILSLPRCYIPSKGLAPQCVSTWSYMWSYGKGKTDEREIRLFLLGGMGSNCRYLNSQHLEQDMAGAPRFVVMVTDKQGPLEVFFSPGEKALENNLLWLMHLYSLWFTGY